MEQKIGASSPMPTVKGIVSLSAFNEKGELVWGEIDHNLVVTLGRESICHLLAGDVTGRSITKIGFGENGTATAISDTALSGTAFVKNVGAVTYPSPSSMIINFTLELAEANGLNIQELALFTANTNMFSRMTRGTIAKTSAIRLVGTWTLSF